MIERIKWHPLPNELESPFQRGKNERPIRITLHKSSFNDLSPEEDMAISMLRNLGDLPELDVMEIEPGYFSYSTLDDVEGAFKENSGSGGLARISPFDPNNNNMSIYWKGDNRVGESDMRSEQFLMLTTYLTNLENPEDPEFKSALNDLIVARAQCSLKRDVLVTKSTQLLERRIESFIQDANPRSPIEAARIVGLFLRSRNNYTYQIEQKKAYIGATRGSFYWTLTNLKLPHFLHYQNMCSLAEVQRHRAGLLEDNTGLAVHSALSRCIRVLQACDAIAEKFYVPSNDEVRSDMLYHFYYLALLLSGIIDVQAIIAYRAYQITRIQEKRASFVNEDFINHLKSNGAVDLGELFSSGTNAWHLLRLLHEIRNTIHRAEFPETPEFLKNQAEVRSLGAFVEVALPSSNLVTLLDAINKYGTPDRWGLIHTTGNILLEPYTFATTLLDECFKLIDKISELTDLSGLFPSDYPLTVSQDLPPTDIRWNLIRKMIAILG